ncbi:hypothetical protein [Desmospora activa]|uniref:Uncharacterized protein n=1 Tax=Desmospora activa DSM 45169 TaxID=1121389 RepID=A0A2T4ZAM0_9BACL|nr:hypothetical protein [Desmospora activa]PTM58938.1 hypothetical protein C8J48_1537 [Desmospora activa DSM 45169]
MFGIHQSWQSVVAELNRSMYGEEMVCSMSSQLFHIPETENLQGNAEMHSHLVPASYHRVTALGSARRLQSGESARSLMKTLTACIQNAERQDRDVRAGLQVMRNAAPAAYKTFVETIIRWQDYTELHLRNAKQLTSQMTGTR